MRTNYSTFEKICFSICAALVVFFVILMLRPTVPINSLILPTEFRQEIKTDAPPLMPVQMTYASVGSALKMAHNKSPSRYALLRDYAMITPSIKTDWLDFKILSDSAALDISRNPRELMLEYPAFDVIDKQLVMLRTSITATDATSSTPTISVAEPIVVSPGSPAPT